MGGTPNSDSDSATTTVRVTVGCFVFDGQGSNYPELAGEEIEVQ